jgi:hypothetical protein
MSPPGNRRGGRRASAGMAHRLLVAVVASALVAGCDETVEPFLDSEDAIFSMFGYLDLNADTQWVRVMPVRRVLFLGPEPIDAVVTLEHQASGRIVTLHDSLFRFVDPLVGGVAYAHNFWTAEPIEPEASYRLVAYRPDGASTTAVVVMPPEAELVFLEDSTGRRRGTGIALFEARAERVLSAEVLYGMGQLAGNPPALFPSTPIPGGGYETYPTPDPGTIGVQIDAQTLIRPGMEDVLRREIRIGVGRSDWPYHADLSDLEVTVPDSAPSNVENGHGFVGGVATWTIPFDACDTVEPRPDPAPLCATLFNAQSASIAGRVIRESCGEPHTLATVRLMERSPGGGGVMRTWKTGWSGEYRFQGIEPNAELLLGVGRETPAIQLPRLAVGERYMVPDIFVTADC